MQKQQTIECTFCKGTGKHPYFEGTCPVCKGKGKNTVVGPFIACRDCRGSGQKRGTTLTCYTCGGLGVVPDTREVIEQAREEIRKARGEMEKEKEEFHKKPSDSPVEEEEGGCFCQSCAKKINRESIIKVCLACFRQMKKE